LPGLEPLCFSFVPARIDDNRELLRRDPGYRARLVALLVVAFAAHGLSVDAAGSEFAAAGATVAVGG
jgi:hypothetical protein